jgi:hypothetical protein
MGRVETYRFWSYSIEYTLGRFGRTCHTMVNSMRVADVDVMAEQCSEITIRVKRLEFASQT